MAEDRKDSLPQAVSSLARSPLKHPMSSDVPYAAAPAGHAEAGKLPSYTEWLELQYAQQLEAAIALNAGVVNAPPPQANAQHTHHHPQGSAAPGGLEIPYLQGSLESPFANQQRADNRFPWLVAPASPGFRSEQRQSYSTGSPMMTARADASSQSLQQHMMLMAQLNMLNAASGSSGGQPADQTMRPSQSGGQPADQTMRPDQFGSE